MSEQQQKQSSQAERRNRKNKEEQQERKSSKTTKNDASKEAIDFFSTLCSDKNRLIFITQRKFEREGMSSSDCLATVHKCSLKE